MKLQLEQFVPDLKLKNIDNQAYVFDPCRNKYVHLNREEMVRQLFIQFFIQNLFVPKSLISIEKTIDVNGLKKRYDIAIYNSGLEELLLLVELKNPEIPMTNLVLDQVSIYNSQLEAPFILVSNGSENYLFDVKSKTGNGILNEWPKQLTTYLRRAEKS